MPLPTCSCDWATCVAKTELSRIRPRSVRNLRDPNALRGPPRGARHRAANVATTPAAAIAAAACLEYHFVREIATAASRAKMLAQSAATHWLCARTWTTPGQPARRRSEEDGPNSRCQLRERFRRVSSSRARAWQPVLHAGLRDAFCAASTPLRVEPKYHFGSRLTSLRRLVATGGACCVAEARCYSLLSWSILSRMICAMRSTTSSESGRAVRMVATTLCAPKSIP
jgi:hypothetical protein